MPHLQKFVCVLQISIFSFFPGCKLFGEGFSGLEYDYRGLINLYSITGKLVCVDILSLQSKGQDVNQYDEMLYFSLQKTIGKSVTNSGYAYLTL